MAAAGCRSALCNTSCGSGSSNCERSEANTLGGNR
jgi:hypothetical protein